MDVNKVVIGLAIALVPIGAEPLLTLVLGERFSTGIAAIAVLVGLGFVSTGLRADEA